MILENVINRGLNNEEGYVNFPGEAKVNQLLVIGEVRDKIVETSSFSGNLLHNWIKVL